MIGEFNFVSVIEWLWLVDEGYCLFFVGVGKILMNLLCGFGGINWEDLWWDWWKNFVEFVYVL